MRGVKEKGVKVRSFKGSLGAREDLEVLEKEVQKAAESDLYVVDEKAVEPKAKKAEPKDKPEKRIRKAKFSVAIDPVDLALLRKVAKKAGKPVSLFVAELVGERVRK